MKPTKMTRRMAIFNAEQAAFAATHRWDDESGKWARTSSDEQHQRLSGALRDVRRMCAHGATHGIHPAFA